MKTNTDNNKKILLDFMHEIFNYTDLETIYNMLLTSKEIKAAIEQYFKYNLSNIYAFTGYSPKKHSAFKRNTWQHNLQFLTKNFTQRQVDPFTRISTFMYTDANEQKKVINYVTDVLLKELNLFREKKHISKTKIKNIRNQITEIFLKKQGKNNPLRNKGWRDLLFTIQFSYNLYTTIKKLVSESKLTPYNLFKTFAIVFLPTIVVTLIVYYCGCENTYAYRTIQRSNLFLQNYNLNRSLEKAKVAMEKIKYEADKNAMEFLCSFSRLIYDLNLKNREYTVSFLKSFINSGNIDVIINDAKLDKFITILEFYYKNKILNHFLPDTKLRFFALYIFTYRDIAFNINVETDCLIKRRLDHISRIAKNLENRLFIIMGNMLTIKYNINTFNLNITVITNEVNNIKKELKSLDLSPIQQHLLLSCDNYINPLKIQTENKIIEKTTDFSVGTTILNAPLYHKYTDNNKLYTDDLPQKKQKKKGRIIWYDENKFKHKMLTSDESIIVVYLNRKKTKIAFCAYMKFDFTQRKKQKKFLSLRDFATEHCYVTTRARNQSGFKHLKNVTIGGKKHKEIWEFKKVKEDMRFFANPKNSINVKLDGVSTKLHLFSWMLPGLH